MLCLRHGFQLQSQLAAEHPLHLGGERLLPLVMAQQQPDPLLVGQGQGRLEQHPDPPLE